MSDLGEIRQGAEEAARAALRSTAIDHVSVEDELSMDGDDLLRVRIIVPDGKAAAIDLDQFLAAVIGIKDAVRRIGDPRRAIVGFITPSEIEQLADPEP